MNWNIEPLKPIESRILDLDANQFVTIEEIQNRYNPMYHGNHWKIEMPNWDNYQHLTVYSHNHFKREDVLVALKTTITTP